MNPGFSAKGGAQLGSVNASWPMATLTASPHELRLRVTLLGDYRFAPSEVTALAAVSSGLGKGLQIRHARPNAPARIVFWGFGKTVTLLEAIHAAGFIPTGPGNAKAPPAGWPLRWGVTIGVAAVWNALLLLDFFRTGKLVPLPGPFSLLALGLVSLGAVGLRRHAGWREFALRPGRHVGEIEPHLRLLLFVAGVMFVTLGGLTLLRITVLDGP